MHVCWPVGAQTRHIRLSQLLQAAVRSELHPGGRRNSHRAVRSYPRLRWWPSCLWPPQGVCGDFPGPWVLVAPRSHGHGRISTIWLCWPALLGAGWSVWCRGRVASPVASMGPHNSVWVGRGLPRPWVWFVAPRHRPQWLQPAPASSSLCKPPHPNKTKK